MRPLPLLAALLFLAAPPPPADAQAAAGLDEDGCIDLAAKMDADAKAKRPPTAKEEEAIDGCVAQLTCDRVRQAADAEKVPEAAYADYETTIRYVLKECGHTGYKPELTPGEKFMREKP